MCTLRLVHLLAIVPIAMLLTVSFFVLFTLSKIEEKALKAFGYIVVGFLWLATLVVFSGAVYKMTQGPRPMKSMMQQKMKMDCMSKMMQKDNSSGMIMSDKGPMVKAEGNKGIVSKTK